MNSISSKAIEGMRARELRNLLIQKLGFSANEVSKMIDREELKEMVYKVYYEEQRQQLITMMAFYGQWILIVVIIIATLFLFREAIEEACRSLINYISLLLLPDQYKVSQKWRLIYHSWKKSRYTAAIALLIGLQMEFASAYIQICSIAGWFLSHDSMLRRFFLPTLSVPMNTAAMLGQVGIRSQMGSYFNIDVGPMLTVMLMGWIVRQLEEFAAAQSIDEVRERNERRQQRAMKRFKKSFGFPTNSNNNSTSVDHFDGEEDESADPTSSDAMSDKPRITLDSFIRRGPDAESFGF